MVLICFARANLFRERVKDAAKNSIAKHDENYMPREVVDVIKRSGHWCSTQP